MANWKVINKLLYTFLTLVMLLAVYNVSIRIFETTKAEIVNEVRGSKVSEIFNFGN